jgi:hypothetical protein
MTFRYWLKRILKGVALTVAVLYFLIDVLFLSIIKFIFKHLANIPVIIRVSAWIASLGPYPTLALFLIPIILLEPVKPVAAYLVATGHAVYGVLIIIVGEAIKIAVVERMFQMNRDKLMSIPAFAWAYNLVMPWLDYLRALPAWQAVLQRYEAAKAAVREIIASWRKRSP